MQMQQTLFLVASLVLLSVTLGPIEARNVRGQLPAQYMADYRIRTACMKVLVPENGLATIAESSGDPGLDELVLKRANEGRKATDAVAVGGAASKLLPVTFDMSDVISGGRDLCPEARSGQSRP